MFTASDSQGTIPFILDYKDQAGNIGKTIDETDDESEVILDMNPPSEFKVETVGSLYGGSKQKQKKNENDKSESKLDEDIEFGLFPIIAVSISGFTSLIYLVALCLRFSVKLDRLGGKYLCPFSTSLFLQKFLVSLYGGL